MMGTRGDLPGGVAENPALLHAPATLPFGLPSSLAWCWSVGIRAHGSLPPEGGQLGYAPPQHPPLSTPRPCCRVLCAPHSWLNCSVGLDGDGEAPQKPGNRASEGGGTTRGETGAQAWLVPGCPAGKRPGCSLHLQGLRREDPQLCLQLCAKGAGRGLQMELLKLRGAGPSPWI